MHGASRTGSGEDRTVADKVRIAVVEDEDAYADQLENYIGRFGREKGISLSLTRFRDGDEIAEDYRGGFDIILMDIQMTFMDGMTAAARIRDLDRNVVIMFITNRTDYALQGYQVDALDYVVKPVSYYALSSKLERAIGRIPDRVRKTVLVQLPGGVRRMEADRILYVESSRHNLIYHLDREDVTVRGRMQDAEADLQGCGFFRIHKGYLVNLLHVTGLQDQECLLGETRIPVSRNKRTQFMQLLMQHLGDN